MRRLIPYFGILLLQLFLTISNGAFSQSFNLEDSQQKFEKAVEDKNNGKAAYHAYEIAKFYWDENSTEKADEYISESISFGRKSDDNTLLYLAYQLYGSILSENGDFNKALSQYQRSLKLARDMNKNEFIKESLIDVGLMNMELGKHKRSVDPLTEALSLSIRDQDLPLQLKCYEWLIEIHKNLGENGKVSEYQNLYDNIISNQQKEKLTERQLMEMEREVDKADKEKKTVKHLLSRQSRDLRRTEDSLLTTKYSLEETEQSLKLAEEVSENQRLQIDLLNSDRQLAEIRIKEQQARLKNAALLRNSIVVATMLAGSLVFVIILSYRRKLAANREIERQNQNIQSSINYAKRIQDAMLHKSQVLGKLLPDSFVLYKPRDVVSGDFYWVSEIKSWYDPDIVITAADCTGHGIPGAFMSMIGINALNGIISQGIAESDQILNALDIEVRTALQQETTGNKDGMDIALCIYRKEKSILEFSGAKNPLVYIQDNELHQIRGDVHSIGGNQPKEGFSFKKHMIPIDQPTTFYLFSDGFQDQFGGENNAKFMSKRFKKLLFEIHEKPMQEQLEILTQTLNDWKGSVKQTDDILVMGIKLDNFLED